MKTVKKMLVGLTAFGAVALGAGAARADYICSVEYFPNNSTIWGTEGALYFNVYTGKNCTGTLVKAYALCSASATSSSCASGRPNERHTLLANFQAMQRAAAADQKITVNTATCIGGTAGCASYAKFWAE